jgi:hypothetical protein
MTDDCCGEWPPIKCEIVNLDEFEVKDRGLRTVCGLPAGPGDMPVVDEWPQPWEKRAARRRLREQV